MMKKDFDIPEMLKRIEKSIQLYPKAAMFELADKGFGSLFEQLISCIISIRTLDETTIPISEKLFAEARMPQALMNLGAARLTELLYGSQYPAQKAETMLGIARFAIEQHRSELPADYESLIALKGVGPKCAKLALGVATQYPGISVDVHVHRVVNRWGLLQTKTPEKTMSALEGLIPKQKWIDINRLLMPFGKHICTAMAPHCSTCPVLEYCRQVGVGKHR